MSLNQCIVPGCFSRQQRLTADGVFVDTTAQVITLHKFPPHFANKWCDQLKLNAFQLPNEAAVCSLHFSQSMFADSNYFQDDLGTICRNLKSRAYPDINLPSSVRVTETIRFDDATIVRILRAIRGHRCLWDPTFDAYWNVEQRSEALQLVTQEMNYDEEPLLETIDEIRKVFVRQLAASKLQPDSPTVVGWFKEAQFIRDGVSNAEITASENVVKNEAAVELVTFPSTCRICLERESTDTSPFEELQSNPGLVEVFEKLTDFKIFFDRGDHLPAHICMSCKSWMMASHSFVARCQRTEVVMQKMYQCDDANEAVDILAELRADEIIEEVESESEDGGVEISPEANEPPIMEPEGLEPTIDWIIDRKYEVLENIWESFDQKAMNFELSSGSFEGQLDPGIPDLEVNSGGELLQNRNITKLLCPFCGTNLPPNEVHEDHMKTCRLNPDATKEYFECFACQERYVSKLRLLYHLRRKHYFSPDNFNCRHCDRVYTSNSALFAHVRQHHLPNRPFKCDQCDMSYNFKYKLEEHIRSIHTKETPFACHICPVLKSTKLQLKRHITTAHTRNPVECQECGKVFQQERYLKAHAAVHLQKGKYKCLVCGSSFFDNRNMREHVRKQHPLHRPPPKGSVVKEDLWPIMADIEEELERAVNY